MARRVSQVLKSHGALVEGCNRLKSSFEFTVEKVRGTSSAVEAEHARQTRHDGRQEKGVDNIDKEQSEIESRGRESQLHDEKYTQRKNSRTSSHEDKVEMQDITSKYEVGNYVGKPEMEHRSHRDVGARACDESGSTGPERWRATPRISRSSSSRTRRGAVDEARIKERLASSTA